MVEYRDTDKAQLAADIAAAEKYVKRTNNFWAKRALLLMKEEYEANYFDDAGEETEIPIPDGPPVIQISPEEVLDADGWWTAEVTGFTTPKYNRKLKKVDISEGLKISKKRSNGAHLIFNAEETAKLWMEQPKAVSEALGFRASPRLIKLAGTMLRGRLFLLPTFHLAGANGLDDYAIKPEVPYNDAEMKIWYDNFLNWQSKGSLMFGSKLQWRFPVRLYPEGIDVDPENGKHVIPIFTNKPSWILAAVMADYNTDTFKHDTYNQARRLAHSIDAGAPRVPGYTHPTEWGTVWGAGDGDEALERYYQRMESTNGKSRPRFEPGVIEV